MRDVLEGFRGHQRGAVGRAVGQAVGIGLGVVDQFLHGLGRNGGVDQQRKRQLAHARHGREILDGVVLQALDQPGVGRVRGVGGHEQRVAVRLGLGHMVGGDLGIGAGLVVHDHGLLEPLAQPGSHHARHGIGSTAGRERHDQGDGVGGIAALGLRSGRCNDGHGTESAKGQGPAQRGMLHLLVSCFLSCFLWKAALCVQRSPPWCGRQ